MEGCGGDGMGDQLGTVLDWIRVRRRMEAGLACPELSGPPGGPESGDRLLACGNKSRSNHMMTLGRERT